MGRLILVCGTNSSGKSAFAEKLAAGIGGDRDRPGGPGQAVVDQQPTRQRRARAGDAAADDLAAGLCAQRLAYRHRRVTLRS